MRPGGSTGERLLDRWPPGLGSAFVRGRGPVTLGMLALEDRRVIGGGRDFFF